MEITPEKILYAGENNGESFKRGCPLESNKRLPLGRKEQSTLELMIAAVENSEATQIERQRFAPMG